MLNFFGLGFWVKFSRFKQIFMNPAENSYLAATTLLDRQQFHVLRIPFQHEVSTLEWAYACTPGLKNFQKYLRNIAMHTPDLDAEYTEGFWSWVTIDSYFGKLLKKKDFLWLFFSPWSNCHKNDSSVKFSSRSYSQMSGSSSNSLWARR